MEVGEKYILEVEDVIDIDGTQFAKMKGFQTLLLDEKKLRSLERSSDAAESLDEAYCKGFKAGQQFGEIRKAIGHSISQTVAAMKQDRRKLEADYARACRNAKLDV